LNESAGALATLAISAYVDVVRKVQRGELTFDADDAPGALEYEVRDHLRRALQLGRRIGWDKPATQAARDVAAELRKAANDAGTTPAVHWFSELDLDFGVSPIRLR
jgi:hypothetical protein